MSAEHIIVHPHAGHGSEETAEHPGEEPPPAAVSVSPAIAATVSGTIAAPHPEDGADKGDNNPDHQEDADDGADPANPRRYRMVPVGLCRIIAHLVRMLILVHGRGAAFLGLVFIHRLERVVGNLDEDRSAER